MIRQVKFHDYEGSEFGGIMLEDGRVICGCCGGVYEPNDPDIHIITEYEHWVNISEEITGDA